VSRKEELVMGKKRVDYATLRMGFGLSRGLGEEFIQACERNNVSIEAIHRLVTPKGRSTMDEIACRILTDWQAEQPKSIKMPEAQDGHPYRSGLPLTIPTVDFAAVTPNSVLMMEVPPYLHQETSEPAHSPFSAPIVYVQPEFEELKRRFPTYVHPDYKGKWFDPIVRCKGVSTENREVAFEYVHMNRDASTDEVLAEMDRKGLRPALYEELLGFAEKYPDEQRKYPIVALGSETGVHGIRCVAYLWRGDHGRNLCLGWVDDDWDDRDRFLAVRK
jgi:hypothetical protein